jgi:putative addiction module component (TIGR02574 family)
VRSTFGRYASPLYSLRYESKLENMSPEASNLLNSALQLPQSARAFLAEKLLESLDAETVHDVSDEWRAEIKRRCEEIDRGEVELISAEDAFSRAYAAIE